MWFVLKDGQQPSLDFMLPARFGRREQAEQFARMSASATGTIFVFDLDSGAWEQLPP